MEPGLLPHLDRSSLDRSSPHFEKVDNHTMKRFLISLVAGTAMFLGPTLFAQNTPMYFNGGYQGKNWTYGSETVGTGFYDGSINGVQVGPGQAGGPGMICDDFKDNIYAGEHWTANGMNAASLSPTNIGQTLFGGLGVQGYDQLAYLAYQMLSHPGMDGTTQAAYSEAIWALTGGVTLDSTTTAYTLYQNVMSGTETLTQSQLASLWIYTPNPRTDIGKGEAQEMWGLVPVPEGGATLVYLFLAGISCFGAMFLRLRRERIAPTA